MKESDKSSRSKSRLTPFIIQINQIIEVVRDKKATENGNHEITLMRIENTQKT